MSLDLKFILAISMMLCLALGIIMFVILYQRRVINHQIQIRDLNREKQLELMQASIRSEEEERMRIAAELHDDVGATLSSIRLYLHQAARKPDDTALIAQTKDLLDETIQKVRNISHQLQPGTLQYLGLTKSLQSLAEMITRSGSMHMEVVLPEDDIWPEPDGQVALSLYRIIQELVNNITKHAGATWIRLSMHGDSRQSYVRLAHNGNGLTETAYQEQLFKKGAIGLKNIENRLKSAGLHITLPDPEDGTYSIILSSTSTYT